MSTKPELQKPRMNKSKPKSLLVGKICIIIGAFFGIHPFTVFFSFPIYLIGEIIVWKSNNLSHRSKILWTIIPLISILIIWAVIMIITFIFE